MKKARVFLTAITVFAVVGGALAFNVKAKANIYCLTSTGCEKTIYTTVNNGGTPTTEPCGAGITTYYTERFCNTQQTGTVYLTDL